MSAGVIVAIVAALVIVVILIVLGILWWMGFIGDCCWNASVEGLLSTSNFLPHFGRKKHLLMKGDYKATTFAIMIAIFQSFS